MRAGRLLALLLAAPLLAVSPARSDYNFGKSVEAFLEETAEPTRPAAAKPHKPFDVCLVLAAHGPDQASYEEGRRWASAPLELIDKELAAFNASTPVALWLEQGIPDGLPDQIAQIEPILARFGEEINLSPLEVAHAFFGRRFDEYDPRLETVLAHLDMTLKAMYINAGQTQLKVTKDVNFGRVKISTPDGRTAAYLDWYYAQKKSGRDIRIVWEMIPYEAWVERLMSTYFSSGTMTETRQGNVDRAAMYMFISSLSDERMSRMRDEALAKGITTAMRVDPERAVFVIRGSGHGQLEAKLASRGVDVKAVRSEIGKGIDASSDFGIQRMLRIAEREPVDDVTPEIRDYSIREIIRSLILVHLSESKKPAGPAVLNRLMTDIDNLAAADIESWVQDIGSVPGLDTALRGEKSLAWLQERAGAAAGS